MLVDGLGSHRKQLKTDLRDFIELLVVGENDTFSGALSDCTTCSPHVLLLNLQHLDDADLLKGSNLLKTALDLKLVVLLPRLDDQMKQKILRIPAQGFALYKTPPQDLVRGIKMVAMGVIWVDSRIPNPYL